MKMIEKMARALFEADCALCADYLITPETWENTQRRPAYSALAKAALTTLLEPNEGMVEAGQPVMITIDLGNGSTFPTPGLSGAPDLIFKRMIQHALAEGE